MQHKLRNSPKNIRALEEALGVWDEDEEEDETELDNEWISAEARRHNKSNIKCKKCKYETNNPTIMKGHLTKHKGLDCTKCKKSFKTQGDLDVHARREHRPDSMNCTKCNKQFNAKNALSQHMNSQHPLSHPVGHSQWAQQKNNSNDYACTQCDSGFEHLNELREHKKTNHKGQNKNGIVSSALPCRFFAQGRCNRRQCQFSHKEQQQQNNKERVPQCSRGERCQFLAWGTCNFYHRGIGVQQPKIQQNRQQTSMKKCHFQDRCWNQNCTFSHEDFSMGTQFQENY